MNAPLLAAGLVADLALEIGYFFRALFQILGLGSGLLAVPVLLLALPGLYGTVSLFRRSRVSLGEFLLLFLAASLAIGLVTIFLSRPLSIPIWDAPSGPVIFPAGLVWFYALAAGLFLVWGGCLGLFCAHQLGVEEPRRRLTLLLGGLLLAPAYLLVLAGEVALILFLLSRPDGPAESFPRCPAVLFLGFLLGGALGLVLILWLDLIAREAQRRWRGADAPPPPPAPEAFAPADGMDGMDQVD
jgi:hypothetical protein